MSITDLEYRYLESQPLGRLATIGPDGGPQNRPVAHFPDRIDRVIDIGGYALGTSQKFRNVQRDGRVSLIVDDIAAARPRGVEIRGRAEALTEQPPLAEGFSTEIIRIHPQQVLSWGL
jgi:pyridoxamine 5'-phosphate oxidase family protein